MPKFRLTFGQNHFDDGLEEKHVEGGTQRIIVADDAKMAWRIGRAMEGEEIYAHEALGPLLSVAETHEEVDLVAWSSEEMLQETLQKLVSAGEEGLQIARDSSGHPVGFSRLTP